MEELLKQHVVSDIRQVSAVTSTNELLSDELWVFKGRVMHASPALVKSTVRHCHI